MLAKTPSVAPGAVNTARLWVDADACPVAVKQILYRAAERAGVALILVAHLPLQVPQSPWIRTVQVARGFDAADKYIVDAVAVGDIVVTADIPLAAAVVDKGAEALNPRGEHYTRANVQSLLAMRDFMDTLRGSGVDTGGPRAFNNADRHAFATQLDRWLARRAH